MFLLILGGAFLAAGLVVLGLIGAGTMDSSLAVMAIIFVLVGLLNGGIGMAMWRGARNRRRILSTGVAGTAVLVAARQTSVEINDQPVIALTLEVRLPDRPPYQVTKRQTIPLLRLASIQPGTSLPVRVDPANPQEVVVDWTGAAPAPSFVPAGYAPTRVNPGGINPNQLDLPVLPPHMATMTVEEQRENVRELGAAGRAIVDAVTVVGQVGDAMSYRLGMWVQLDSGPSFRVDDGPATVESRFAAKVVPGVTVPLRIAHVRPGVTMTVLEWDRL